jgi:hypothetical protein
MRLDRVIRQIICQGTFVIMLGIVQCWGASAYGHLESSGETDQLIWTIQLIYQ